VKALTFLFIVFSLSSCAQNSANPSPLSRVDPTFNPILNDALLDKNFFFLTSILNDQIIKKEFIKTKENQLLAAKYLKNLQNSLTECTDVPCIVQKMKIEDSDLIAATALVKSAFSSTNTDNYFNTSILSSGLFIQYQEMGKEKLIDKVWTDAVAGFNGIMNTYGLGIKPRYPIIDSISFQVKSPDYFQRVKKMLSSELSKVNGTCFFEPHLILSKCLLLANRRDEAARYEPMFSGSNKLAFEQCRKTDWSKFEYSAILVLGDGPETINSPIDPLGKFRVRLGAELYKNKQAPFVIVSGGHVKPFQTRYAEAVEMKRVLMEDHQVPEYAIIIEPHARHTTTNLRNASRLMFRYGFPMKQKALITTSDSQSTYVEKKEFYDRCFRELGYFPVSLQKRISETSIEFTPSLVSLHANSLDPLDP
jgi:DUF218 domain